MKNLLLCATALASFGVFTSAVADPAQSLSKKLDQVHSGSVSRHAATMDQSTNTFGVYKLLPNVELKPANQVQPTDRIGELGDMAAVQKDADEGDLHANEDTPAANSVVMGSVLRNQITGELAEATGSVVVLIEKGDIDEIAEREGLSIERRVPEINLYVLKARKDQNLLDVRHSLLQQEGVKAARIDVLDQAKKPM
ncbi:hypothetical protein [Salinisphaera sp. Q1T1-3]|uniref:hypothetical protein n=1 Tax=Salinisphaera sp. Q1T1-3 TaxID=2321229 RepID=UPI0011C442D5|nr:hypothetical protein [Salinisphaera sp. Q1T1-3]